ncbi:MAG: sugar phosphate isomerase/epimerase family protein [Planctomycetaceae bacterium]
MSPISRRQFQQTSFAAVAGLAGSLISNRAFASSGSKAELSFTIDLTPGAIGVKANQTETIELAHKHGFQSVAPNPWFLADLGEDARTKLLANMKQKNLKWGAAGLPVEFRRDEKTFRDGIAKFAKQCKGLQKSGATRVGTYIMPAHDDLTYMANFRQHASRLRECTKIMADHGWRFGLAYVGTRTLWTAKRHSFIHSMAETKELLSEINMPNTGFVLDSWHWYTAGETVADLKTLKNKDIVACDLNDAPKGIAVGDQIDNRRELPAATGVIDLKSFLTALVEIGYDGPVRAEPFNQPLNKLDNDAACAATAKAIKAAFAMVE